MLDGKTNDEMEAKALINANDLVDIYSGSWGPSDDGHLVDGPGVLGQIALEIGATTVMEKIYKINETVNRNKLFMMQ